MESNTEVLVDGGGGNNNIGENSDDECCLCGKIWDPSQQGWPLCDTPDCPNTCCSECSKIMNLIVSELFYCPVCAGSGVNAAAVVGGSIATSIKVCSELESLPLSQQAIQAILRNIIKQPNEAKYRKLRLNNPKVKSLLDLDPCRRLLSVIGFTDQQDEKNEPVLVLQGNVVIEEMKQLLDILDGISSSSSAAVTSQDDEEEEKNCQQSSDDDKKKKVDEEETTTPKRDGCAATNNSAADTNTNTTDDNDDDDFQQQQEQLQQQQPPDSNKRQKCDEY